MSRLLNGLAFVTLPVWWPTMVAIEVVQVACGLPASKLLGPSIYDKLTAQ